MTDMQNQPPEEVTVVAKESTQQSAVPDIDTEVQNGTINEIATVAEEELTDTTSTGAVLIKKPKADSKLILQNMEEVLKSVKKKHRAKHKRKRELKKLALLEAEAEAEADKVMETGIRKRHNKNPLQLAMENAAATSTHNSILQHFARTPKKQAPESDNHKLNSNDIHDDIIDMLDAESTEAEVEIEIEAGVAAPKRKTNAFEVMMNAQNKSVVGGNTLGKDASLGSEEKSTITTSERNTTQLKCKEILQQWAERKGAGKRKLEEEARAEYVEQQLENRSKRYVPTFK